MKVKQLLYGMMYGLLIFFTVSCSEENSENLPDNVAIYQSYLVAFSDSQPTLTYARFSPEKDVPLKEIKLTGGASIMANGKETTFFLLFSETSPRLCSTRSTVPTDTPAIAAISLIL